MTMPSWIASFLKYGGFGSGVIVAVLVVWFAIAQPMREDFQKVGKDTKEAMDKLTEENRKTREEFGRFREEFKDWTSRVFVSRDLYDQRRAETDRALADLRAEVRELRKDGR